MLHRARVREVYLDAAELPHEQRPAFLDRACNRDADLRAEVESLLAAAALRPEFLASPTAAPARPDEAIGTRIGQYRLLQEIGRGGFGAVYMAEQDQPVRRRVALKIIKLGMDTRAVIARFEAERQALAMMDHPNIARVFDAGATDAGRPYFVMELVRGEPVTRYCDRATLSVPERLDLFTQVCHAVQHAHSKGVIHRDLKPANILVSTEDGRPHAKVIDFGIAKATEQRLTDKTVFTDFRQFIGTPEYMSPEQAEGSLNVDTRSDVYSLGVLLYELLTGSTPFDPRELRTAAYGGIQRIIREVEPERPSTRLSRSASLEVVASQRRTEPSRLSTLLRGDLDWIVMRALEKDRGRRYDTASALAADLGRHLAGEPVEAAPPSRGYRVRKFLRRHRVGALAGALVALSLIGGLGTALWQASMARHDRDLARMASKDADTRRRETELVATLQESQLAGVDPALMARRLRGLLLANAKQSLERRAVPADQIAARQALFEGLLADVNLTSVALDTLNEAIFDDALKAVREQLKDQPIVRARMLHSIARTLVRLSLFDRAAAPLMEALELREGALGPDHPDTIDSVILASELFLEQGDPPKGAQFASDAIARLQRGGSTDGAAMGAACSNLGGALLMQGRQSEAEVEFRKALEAVRRARGPASPEALTMLESLGGVLMETGRHAQAEEEFRKVWMGFRQLKGEEDVDTIRAGANLGYALEQQGKLADAEVHYRETLEKRRRLHGDDHDDTLLAINNMAWLEDERGEHALAESLYAEAIARARRTLGDTHLMTLRYISNLGHSLRARDRSAEAEALYREALAGQLPQLGPDHVHVGISMAGAGGSVLDQSRLAEAEQLLLNAARVFDIAQGVARPERRRCLEDLTTLYELRHKLEPGKGFDVQVEHWRLQLGKTE
jgi:eukaryotic-like serine/threonine-protein kinase